MSEQKRRGEAIVIKGVNKVFEDKGKESLKVLEDINLEIHPGEFISIIGPSGCGKSTLLRAIAGLDTPTSGTIHVGDELVEGPSRHRGFVFQNARLFPWDDVWHNVAAGLIAGKCLKGNEELVDQYIEMVGLKGFEKAFPKELSGGMAQRVSLARALINLPGVLLLDEPLGALDALTRMTMQEEILRIWRKERMTMLFVTHDVDEAIFLADRVLVMSAKPGKVKEVVTIDLPSPRTRDSEQFDEYRHYLLHQVYEGHGAVDR